METKLRTNTQNNSGLQKRFALKCNGRARTRVFEHTVLVALFFIFTSAINAHTNRSGMMVGIDRDTNEKKVKSGVISEAPEGLTVEESSCTVVIPNGFSPNGDGYNDSFKVICIENYPNANLQIFSRTSSLIYEQKHYGNLDFWGSEAEAWWDGRIGSSGVNTLSNGSYIYILDLNGDMKGQIKKGIVFVNK